MHKHIATFRHSYAVFVRTQAHSFRTFAYMTQAMGIDGFDFIIVVGNAVFGDEKGDSTISPQVSCHLVGFVRIVGVVLRAYN